MTNRRDFLKLLGLSAIAVPLAPLIAKAEARSDGTDVALTEGRLRSAFAQVARGGPPTIIGAADVYVSDFGTITFPPNSFRGKMPTWR